MPVSFRGQQRADDEGEKARLYTDKIRCETTVKQEDFIGGERPRRRFGLDITLIVC